MSLNLRGGTTMVKTIEGKAAILVIDVQYDFIKEDVVNLKTLKERLL